MEVGHVIDTQSNKYSWINIKLEKFVQYKAFISSFWKHLTLFK